MFFNKFINLKKLTMTNIILASTFCGDLTKLNDRIYDKELGIGKITLLNDEICEITFEKNNLKQTFLPNNRKVKDDIIRHTLWFKKFNYEIGSEVVIASDRLDSKEIKPIGKIINFTINGGVEIFFSDSNEKIDIAINNLFRIMSAEEYKRNQKAVDDREKAKKDKEEKATKYTQERNYLIENCGYKECEQVHDGKKCGNLHAPEFHMCHKCYIVSRGEKWYRNSYK